MDDGIAAACVQWLPLTIKGPCGCVLLRARTAGSSRFGGAVLVNAYVNCAAIRNGVMRRADRSCRKRECGVSARSQKIR